MFKVRGSGGILPLTLFAKKKAELEIFAITDGELCRREVTLD